MQLDIDLDGPLSALTAELAAAPEKVNLALNRTLRRLSRYAERQVLRVLSRQTGITQASLKQMGRIRVSLQRPGERRSDGYRLVIWIGLDDIPAHYLGKPVETKHGVRTGRWQWPGTFKFHPVNADHEMVFRRVPGSTHRKQRSRRSGRMMWMGLPVEKVGLPISEQAQAAVRKLEPQLRERFEILLAQQLNYTFNIEGRE